MGEFNYKVHKIKVETVLGNELMDSVFFQYLDEYSISHSLTEEMGESGYPLVEYEGGPISLTNMLKERFGLDIFEIQEKYPELNEQQ